MRRRAPRCTWTSYRWTWGGGCRSGCARGPCRQRSRAACTLRSATPRRCATRPPAEICSLTLRVRSPVDTAFVGENEFVIWLLKCWVLWGCGGLRARAALCRGTRGQGIILSSGARSAFELRGPYDVINLATLMGLSEQQAKVLQVLKPL